MRHRNTDFVQALQDRIRMRVERLKAKSIRLGFIGSSILLISHSCHRDTIRVSVAEPLTIDVLWTSQALNKFELSLKPILYRIIFDTLPLVSASGYSDFVLTSAAAPSPKHHRTAHSAMIWSNLSSTFANLGS